MKRYETKEQCLAVNGEHAWKEDDCRVFVDSYGFMNKESAETCYHCPAGRVYRQVQEPKFEWIEE